MSNHIRTYADLRNQIHNALRNEHPEWVGPNDHSPICDAYEARLAELLDLFTAQARSKAGQNKRAENLRVNAIPF